MGIQSLSSVVALCAAASILSACQTIKPNAPLAGGHNAAPKPEISVITVPINVDATVVAAAIDSQLSPANGGVYWVSGQDLGNDASLKIGIHRDGNSTVIPNAGCLDVSIPLKTNDGRVDKKVCVGPPWAHYCHSEHVDIPDRHLDVKAKTCLGVSNDWELTASIDPSFSWPEDPVVRYNLPWGIAALEFNVASKVNPVIQGKLPIFVGMIQTRLAGVKVREGVEKAWLSVQKPMKAWESPAVTLDIVPVSAGIAPLTSSGNTVTLRPSVTALVSAHLGPPGAVPATVPLKNNAGAPLADAFHLQVRALAPFTDMNDALHDSVVGKTWKLDDGREITISDAKTFPYADKVGVRVDFKAKTSFWPVNNVSGWAYLVGKPKFNLATRQMSVEGLDFDAATSSLLVDAATVLAHPYFRSEIQKALAADVSRSVDPFLNKVRAGLAGYSVLAGVKANVTIADLTLSEIDVSDEGVSIFVDAKGNANIAVDSLTTLARTP